MMNAASRIGSRLAAMALAGALALAIAPTLRARSEDRARIEAAYVVNFVRYTEWPDAAQRPPQTPIVVVVHRASKTAAALEAIAAREVRVGDRPLVVRRSGNAQSLGARLAGAHVLYVGADAPAALALVGDAVLTIGRGAAFAEQGGMIALVPLGERVVFDANVAAIRAAGLELSAKVLALARRVEGR